MLQVIKTPIRVKCQNGHWNAVSSEQWEQTEPEMIEHPDWAMGNETHHHLELSDYPCDECGKEISGSIDVWEYPTGTVSARDQSDNVNVDDAASAVTVVP